MFPRSHVSFFFPVFVLACPERKYMVHVRACEIYSTAQIYYAENMHFLKLYVYTIIIRLFQHQ